MPSAHRNALKKLLASIKQRISDDEARLINARDAGERAKIIEEIADLKLRQQDMLRTLAGDGDGKV
jgi:hypothetical protein